MRARPLLAPETDADEARHDREIDPDESEPDEHNARRALVDMHAQERGDEHPQLASRPRLSRSALAGNTRHGLRLPIGVLPPEPRPGGVVVAGSPSPSASSLRPISSPSAGLRGSSAAEIPV